jgi:copper resistance protein B
MTLVPAAANGQEVERQDHSTHEEPAANEQQAPPLTDADRAAAFPEVEGHTVHDTAVNFFVLLDQVEWQTGDGDSASWDAKGWIGGDINRLWFRTEGDGSNGAVDTAETQLLFGRSVSRWWDLVAGVRQDFEPDPSRTWAAIGLQGLAPYWFEVEATGYIGEGWRTHLRLETELDLLVTNRLILQPLLELDFYGKSDPERGLGSGLGNVEAGLRLRYEIVRELAPYVGVLWRTKLFGTADVARASGDETSSVLLLVGVRAWF